MRWEDSPLPPVSFTLPSNIDFTQGGAQPCTPEQVIPPVPSSFTLLRPYLAQFFSRFLRVFTALPRRFQRAPSRNPGPRNGGKGTKSGDLRPSFDTADANQRINWQMYESSISGVYDWGESAWEPSSCRLACSAKAQVRF